MADESGKPRWSRRRKVLVGVLGLLLLALAGHGYWGYSNGRELARGIEALRAAGEPTTAGELGRADVPQDLNAVPLLRAAARSIDRESEAWKALDGGWWPLGAGTRLPLPPTERAIGQAVVDENQAAFPLAAEAAKRTGVDWGIDYSPGMFTLLPDLNEQRSLAVLLEAAALLAHQDGDDARALAYLDQLAFVGRAVGEQHTLVSSLVGQGIAELHAGAVGEVARGLKVDDADPRAVPAAQVRRAIDALLDDEPLRQSRLRALRGERVMQQHTVGALLDGTLSLTDMGGMRARAGGESSGPRGLPYLMSPVLKADAILMLKYMTRAIAAAEDARDWPAFRAHYPDGMGPPGIPWRHPFSNMLLGSLERSSEVYYRLLNHRRLAATALAVRLYAVDHDGRLPASLGELVPAYLAKVPVDGVAGGDKPIGYVADPDRPRLYHVGPNGADDGGRELDPSASRSDVERLSDEVMHLKPHPRPDPPRPSEEDDEMPPEDYQQLEGEAEEPAPGDEGRMPGDDADAAGAEVEASTQPGSGEEEQAVPPAGDKGDAGDAGDEGEQGLPGPE